MKSIIFLILFPLAISLLALLPAHRLAIRRRFAAIANAVLCTVPVYLLVSTLDSGPAYFSIESWLVDLALPVAELVIAAIIVYLSVLRKRYLPVFLVSPSQDWSSRRSSPAPPGSPQRWWHPPSVTDREMGKDLETASPAAEPGHQE